MTKMTDISFPQDQTMPSFRYTRTGFFLIDRPEGSDDPLERGLVVALTTRRFFILDGGMIALLVTAALALIGCALGKN